MIEKLRFSGDLVDSVEVVVTHDLGETVIPVTMSKLSGVEDVALGNFKFSDVFPIVVVRGGGAEDGRRVLTVSHVAYRKLRELGVTYDWQSSNGGCKR